MALMSGRVRCGSVLSASEIRATGSSCATNCSAHCTRTHQLSGGLPKRLSLFALTGLSGALLELLSRLAEHIDVHIYHLNFSGGFWADIVSDRQRARLIATQGEGVDEYLERGNRLLASMGRLGREHLAQLLQLESIESETYRAPPRDTVLGAIQADIVELRDADQVMPFDRHGPGSLDPSPYLPRTHARDRGAA